MRAMRGLAAGALVASLVLIVALVLVDMRRAADAFTPPGTGLYVALDCNVGVPGIQDSCSAAWNQPPPDLQIGVVVGNVDVLGTRIGGFEFSVTANDTVFDPHPIGDGNLNANPDFNEEALPTGGWNCNLFPGLEPKPDADPDPAIIDSRLNCAGLLMTGVALPPGTARTVAIVHYSAFFGGVQFSTDTFSLASASILNEGFTEIANCATTSCMDAGVSWIHVFPTNTPVANDWDNDGVPDGTDNCMFTSNASQVNTDANLIAGSPHYVVDDVTRVVSDAFGDACDSDDDADALYDVNEAPSPPCGFGSTATNALSADTDGDRVVDATECALGFNPTNASNRPTPAQCGAAADADGDRLLDRIEACGYGSNVGDADSDDDGTKDGCEAVSLNTDQVVNSIDQLLLAQEIIRRMGGGAPHVNFDVNKDGNANSADQLLMAQLMIPMGQCP